MDLRQPQLQGDAIRQELLKQYIRATTTSADDVDLLAIDLFATMVQQYETVITYDATKIIAEKFKSTNADEVLLALNVLEECMSKCGQKFHSEVGKFRFLNELIRLVSPQYDGDKTPKKIRDKILDLMLLWTINYPHEKKIKEAYDMLLKRGVKHDYVKAVTIQNANKNETPPKDVKPREKAEPDLASKLKGLLHSSNPVDHKKANLLIQNMVKEKERRHEMKMRRKLELKEITENASLLKDMLDEVEQTHQNGSNENTSEDALVTMKHLYESCQKLQPTIIILLGDNDENECLNEALDANELVTDVFQKYYQLIIRKMPNTANSCLISTSNANESATSQNGRNTLDELSEIFASTNVTSTNSSANPITVMSPTKLLEPILISSNAAKPTMDSTKSWDALEDFKNPSLATNLMSDNSSHIADLLNNPNNLSSKPSTSVPTSSSIPMAPSSDQIKVNTKQQKLQNFDSELTEMISGLKSNLKKDSDESPIDQDDDKILLHSDIEPLELKPVEEQIKEQITSIQEPTTITLATSELLSIDNEEKVLLTQTITQSSNVVKRLADIVIDLNTIRPHDIHAPRCILDDKSGLKIILNFAKDKPRSDVAVLVITTTNQSHLPITNYQFEASVPKPCKLHLQNPSGHALPGVKPFRPPTEDVTQVLLIANAEQKPIKLMCIISYLLGDDPDPVKEFLEINDLPELFN